MELYKLLICLLPNFFLREFVMTVDFDNDAFYGQLYKIKSGTACGFYSIFEPNLKK